MSLFYHQNANKNQSIWNYIRTFFLILTVCKIKNCTNLIYGAHGCLMIGSCWDVPEFCLVRILKCYPLWYSWGALTVLRIVACLQTSKDIYYTSYTHPGYGFSSGLKPTSTAGSFLLNECERCLLLSELSKAYLTWKMCFPPFLG